MESARSAFGRRAWGEARSAFVAAAGSPGFTLDDFDRHAIAAHLVGDEPECRDVLTRGHRAALETGDVTRAVRFAFWLAHSMIFTGEFGQANGWIARARNLLSERGAADCVEWGYLLVVPAVEQLLGVGDAGTAYSMFTEAVAIARRFADADLLAMAGHGRGRALIRLDRPAEGIEQLDEVMVAVATREVSPLIVGNLYCGVLEACQEVFDLHRAREWTATLSRWCEDQPDLVPYRGPCLVHRVELMRLHGDWEGALEEARQACDWLSLPTSPEGPGDAFYQLGELHRLRGNFADAEEAYRQASRLGRPPDPGLALLALARGQDEAAEAAIRRALSETDPVEVNRRAELLSAHVEALLAMGDVTAARVAAEELDSLASRRDALPLRGLADRALGSVLVASGEPEAALAPLRRSWSAWKQIDAPYEGARVRAVIAMACRALGDEESAAMEEDAARWVFERLGATPDLGRLGETLPSLTAREVEVLCLIAAGETNKAIAAALVISEHTVARHVQNMLHKIGVSSRASLAAFAVEHGIVPRSPGQK